MLFFWGVGLVLLVYLGLLAWLWASQRSLLYHPGGDPGPPPEGWEEVKIPTRDGLVLKGWFKKGQPEKGGILYLHGNAGNRKDALEDMVLFEGTGRSLLVPDWRGYGGNPGTPTEEGLYRDGLAALDALARLAGLPAERILVAGRSLGSAVAVEIALERKVQALILLTPFTSIPEVGASLYPWAPVRLLCRDRFDELSRAGRLNLPVLILAGEKDDLAPPEMGRRLAERIHGASYVVIPGVGHGDLVSGGVGASIREIGRFLAEL